MRPSACGNATERRGGDAESLAGRLQDRRGGCTVAFHAVLEDVQAFFQHAEANELVSVPIFPPKTVVDELAVQLFHAGGEIVLKLETREEPVEKIKFDTVIAGIGRDFAGIGDLRAGNKLLHLIGDVPHLIVLAIAADVDGFVEDAFLLARS